MGPPRSTTSPAPATAPSATEDLSPGPPPSGQAPAGPPPKTHVAAIVAGLAATWPDATCELDHQDAYQLLCATILAAQSTDRMINTLTPGLFARYPDARALAAADPAELEPLIYRSGFFRAKARNLIGMARALVERHDGVVPADLDALVALPGVARKTANVVLSSALGVTVGVVVDTHVARLSGLLGLTTETDPVKIERDLMAALPKREWKSFADRLIWHGRRVCFAKRPECERCTLAPLCPSASIAGDARGAPEKKVAKKPAAKKPAAKKPAAKKPAAKKPAAKQSAAKKR